MDSHQETKDRHPAACQIKQIRILFHSVAKADQRIWLGPSRQIYTANVQVKSGGSVLLLPLTCDPQSGGPFFKDGRSVVIARSFLDPPFCSTPEQSSLSSDPYYNHTPARANPRQYSSVRFQLSVKTGLQDVGLQSPSALRKLQLFTSIIILVSSPCKSRVFVKYHKTHRSRKEGDKEREGGGKGREGERPTPAHPLITSLSQTDMTKDIACYKSIDLTACNAANGPKSAVMIKSQDCMFVITCWQLHGTQWKSARANKPNLSHQQSCWNWKFPPSIQRKVRFRTNPWQRLPEFCVRSSNRNRTISGLSGKPE